MGLEDTAPLPPIVDEVKPMLPNHTHTLPPEGVWFVYAYDIGAYPIAVHTDELEARRIAAKEGYGALVVFWPNGVFWGDLEKP